MFTRGFAGISAFQLQLFVTQGSWGGGFCVLEATVLLLLLELQLQQSEDREVAPYL